MIRASTGARDRALRLGPEPYGRGQEIVARNFRVPTTPRGSRPGRSGTVARFADRISNASVPAGNRASSAVALMLAGAVLLAASSPFSRRPRS